MFGDASSTWTKILRNSCLEKHPYQRRYLDLDLVQDQAVAKIILKNGNCGRFLTEAELEENYQKCVETKNNKNKLKCLLRSLQNECYKKFITIVEFDCLPVPVPKLYWQSWNIKSLTKLQQICDANSYYCPPPKAKCDRCLALIDKDSQFYQICGNSIDEKLRLIWFRKCRYSPGHCHWNVILSQIIGYCHFYWPDTSPDFCGKLPVQTLFTQ
ncbi:hypothetical protein LSH36_243g03018 [Paralvinella palmiformis]|uniref:Uncharacterized protein n=1 Tax=Paralvinella palmiformis TaxID=53620 RepID=A0AAD9JLP6_9ANNE|nr:hypothetical protein LSH36_243g03018 [Paralvinella palmiformis]